MMIQLRKVVRVLALAGTGLAAASATTHAADEQRLQGTDILQTFQGVQNAQNLLNVNSQTATATAATQILNLLPQTSGHDAAIAGLSGTVSQTATNAANVLYAPDGSFADVTQIFDGEQIAVNRLIAGSGSDADLFQKTVNIANLATANNINELTQRLTDGTIQSGLNEISLTSSAGDINQTGMNLANIGYVENTLKSVMQDFPSNVTQDITNHVRNTGGGGVDAGAITQTGINIGNLVVADNVEHLHRVFDGSQIVRNVVDPGVNFSQISQSGINIANYAIVSRISKLEQFASGEQIVINEIAGQRQVCEHSMCVDSGPRSSLGSGASQSTINIVNYVQYKLGSPSLGGENIALSQEGQMTQSVPAGGHSTSQVGNAVEINQ